MDEILTLSNSERRHFRHGTEIKGLRGGVHNLISTLREAFSRKRYAAQENPKIDTARAEKGTFRMENQTLRQLFDSLDVKSKNEVIL